MQASILCLFFAVDRLDILIFSALVRRSEISRRFSSESKAFCIGVIGVFSSRCKEAFLSFSKSSLFSSLSVLNARDNKSGPK